MLEGFHRCFCLDASACLAGVRDNLFPYEKSFHNLLRPSSPSFGPYMDVAVIGNLAHYIVDDELAVSVFLARN